jgi:hypothetical protein
MAEVECSNLSEPTIILLNKSRKKPGEGDREERYCDGNLIKKPACPLQI